MLPKLPLDISTFREMRKSRYLYVDKTRYAYDLITGGRRYFLSRPRRFGKSLLVSMMKEVLSGEKNLFDGLWIAKSDYQWQPHGVIVLDFSLLSVEDAAGFKSGLIKALIRIAKSYGITEQIDTTNPGFTLHDIVEALHNRFGRVAILIDEYDNPILNSIHQKEHAKGIRDAMKHFFAVIKGLDEYVNFVFITGVSAFAKAGLFSGINNLQIITLANKFSGICGYTDQEVDHCFTDYIQAWASKKNLPYDDLREQIRDWYNGYQFGENVPTVYNPFSLMNALAAQVFRNFWIKSGTPTFLIEQLKYYHSQHGNIVVDFEGLEVSDDILQSFDVDELPLPALMFQAGYITLSGYNEDSKLYSLQTPNREVEIAVKGYLLEMITTLNTHAVRQISDHLSSALNDGNVEKVISTLRQLFASVPYHIHLKDEKFYHALIHTAFIAAGVTAQSEYATSNGRADMLVTTEKFLYVIELKFNKPAEFALQQIKERRYHEQFSGQGKTIILLGIACNREPKNFDVTYASEKL